jgi:hypothetical protein
MVLRFSLPTPPGFFQTFACSTVSLLILFARIGTGLAEQRIPDAASIAAVDAALPKMALLLPSSIDSETELIKVRRENLDIVYTIQFRSQAKADQLRKTSDSNPQLFQVLMNKMACEPEPNKFLQDGFAIIWELVDAKGPISRSSLTLSDCK